MAKPGGGKGKVERQNSVVREHVDLPLAVLRKAEWNANRVPQKTMDKIRRSVEKFGFVENLVVRVHPSEPKAYEVLSGNHRLEILKTLGVEFAPCVIVEADDAHARILAQTLNRTRGRDDPKAYRDLLDEVIAALSVEEIVAYLPESAHSIREIIGAQERPIVEVPELWGVIVDCRDEGDQADLLDRLLAEGRSCRALMT